MSTTLNGLKKTFSRVKNTWLDYVSLVKIAFYKFSVWYGVNIRGVRERWMNDDIYTTIDEMPVWNWHKIGRTGDLRYLFKKYDPDKKRQAIIISNSSKLEHTWIELQQQFMEEFGVDDMMRQRIRYMRNIINLNVKFIKTRDRAILNQIKIEEAKLKNIEQVGGVSFYRVLDAISTYKGFRIDPKTFTVIEWHHALKNMSRSHGDNN